MGDLRTKGSAGAAMVAFILLIGSGIGYRLLAAEYARAALSTPIEEGTLAQLPMTIGDWEGSESELDDRIIEATDTNDHVNRTYRRRDGAGVGLFVGYGVNLRDLAPHRPEVCYPGAGWSLDDRQEISLDDESGLRVQVQRFFKGGLGADRVTVLNYYLVDGHYCQNVALLRSRAWKRDEGAAFAAQVQVVCGGNVNHQAAEAWVTDFARVSAPLIRDLLVSAVEKSVSASN